MTFRQFLQTHNVYLDGGMGTLLQARGLGAGEQPERWNITHADEIIAVHKGYFAAGSNVVCANTFGANALHFDEDELELIIQAAMQNAKAAKASSISTHEKFIAMDIGPLGKLLSPYGDLAFEDAVTLFKKSITLGVKYGAELIFIETMNDSYETKAALLAAKESCDLPVLVCNAYGEDGKLMTGASPEAMVALIEGMGADGVGANCSLGPSSLVGVVKALLKASSIPVIFKPNAGLPKVVDGETVFDLSPAEFAAQILPLMQEGVRAVGGCCGTTPEHIKSLAKVAARWRPRKFENK